MKRIHAIIPLLCLVSCTLIQIGPAENTRIEYQELWYLKNLTGMTLRVETSDFYIPHPVEPGDSVAVSYSFKVTYQEEVPKFEDLCATDSICVYDVDGRRLQYWIPSHKYIHKKFYTESSWFHFAGNYGSKTVYYWVYELSKDDLRMSGM